MATLACKASSVKRYEAELAVLDAELEAAQVANDPSRWLVAWNAREDLQIARDLEEHPPCSDDDDSGPPAESEDGPCDLDRIWDVYYCLGRDCADAAPGEDLGTLALWVARLAYERGWMRGMEDRRTWLDAMEWESIEAAEAEVRGVLAGRPAWDWDTDDVAERDA